LVRKQGKFGGISIGTPAETLKNTITAQYLNGEMKIEVPSKARATENS
jgi:excinuclease ABC subunit A